MTDIAYDLKDVKQTKLTQLLPGAWVAHGLLTEVEVAQLQSDATEKGMRHVEALDGSGSTTDARLRDCTRCTLDRPDLATCIWDRLQPHLEAEVTIDGSEDAHLRGLPAGDAELHGVWRPYGVNHVFRICRYPGAGRGHFGPHQDSSVEIGPHDRSLLTINGYLNALPEGVGGCTRFLVDELPMYKDERNRFTVEDPSASVLASVRPAAPGMASVFYHGRMHDSSPLSEAAPPKWIFRSEVLFRRVPESAPDLPAEAAVARALENAAARIEAGDAMRSMALYQLGQKVRDGRLSADVALARAKELRQSEDEVDTDAEDEDVDEAG